MADIKDTAETAHHFKLIQKFKADYCPTEFFQYESQRTGMRVVAVNQKGPKVNGCFTLATQVSSDAGTPHTLEHLVFMGSRSYKYKGFLDKLATRSYSDTNAWTDVDNTTYTLSSAGWDGFAQVLPIYLEHVVLPTITDSACHTEVYHINGKGQDGGVVYSEMQGTQNSQAELMELRCRRHVYPEGVGYRYETGGLMERLRVLTAEQIRDYHKDMYQPKNLCLVLIGEIDHKNLFEILEKFETSIQDLVPRLDEPFDRPWVKGAKTPALAKSILDTVEFPEEEESMGTILIGFLGPDCNDDLLVAALGVFLVYICGSSISLLENTLVENEQLASAVYYSTTTRSDTLISFDLSGVETSNLEKVEKRFFEVLKDASDQPLNMDYLRDCLIRTKRQIIFVAESSAGTFREPIVYDHLYGARDGSNLRTLGSLAEYDTLEAWTESEWKNFFKTWLIDRNHVTILGKPSRSLSKKLEDEENARVEARKSELGEAGLQRLAEKLTEATRENEQPIPEQLLKKFSVPTTESIHFIPSITARSGLAKKMGALDNPIQSLVDAEASDFPMFIHFEHIPTNFVNVNVVINTHAIPVHLRPLLTIYVMNFFDTPVIRNGIRVEFEEIVTQLERDTIGYNMSSAGGLGNTEALRVTFQVEPSKYKIAIEWMRDLLYNSIFDKTRLLSTFSKILLDIPEEKRDGSTMNGSISGMINLSRKSSMRAKLTLVKAVYLKRCAMSIAKGSNEVIEKLEKVRSILTDVSNMRIFVVANLESGAVKYPVSSWSSLVPKASLPSVPKLNPLDSAKETLSDACKQPGNQAVIVPMRTIDSSYANLVATGLGSYFDPALPALSVALVYLDSVEGPLWTAVRGAGLAYGASFTRDLDAGLLSFGIYRASNCHGAYDAARTCIEKISTGETPIDELALEGAISSIVVAFADEQPTMGAAAAVGFMYQVVKGIPKDWGVDIMRQARAVTASDVRSILKKVVLPVFDPSKANLVITCSAAQEKEIVSGYQKAGFKAEVKQLSDFQDDYGLEAPEGMDGDGFDELDESEEADESDANSSE
ncbi:MAG: hypothetical protein M1828_005484 [Chrysothrix sp. TS-e1954]|nr:MAG: hypothetical protein M1828_005484 [Chrysothrix sp. TS-e1954]